MTMKRYTRARSFLGVRIFNTHFKTQVGHRGRKTRLLQGTCRSRQTILVSKHKRMSLMFSYNPTGHRDNTHTVFPRVHQLTAAVMHFKSLYNMQEVGLLFLFRILFLQKDNRVI